MAGIMVISARHGQGYAESFAGVLYLLCGVVFPLELLPAPLQAVGRAIPFTYWIEGVRAGPPVRAAGSPLPGCPSATAASWPSCSPEPVDPDRFRPVLQVDGAGVRDRGLIDQVTEH